MARGFARDHPGTAQVGRDDAVELCRLLFKRIGHVGNAGIVHHNGRRPPLRDDALERAQDRIVARHVHLDKIRLAAGVRNALGNLRHIGTVGQNDMRTLARQRFGKEAPEPARSAGHQRDAICEPAACAAGCVR
jgi:hypothetical protein